MSTSVRVRFAPSPTGYLHVGGARTALFNWLHARKTGGKFLLRIEDTDRERSSEEHTRIILDGLAWLGLDWDEDLVFQGSRLPRHQEVADRLAESGHAYLEEGALRFRMPQDEIAWDDFVHERISFKGSDIKDWVILRSDRTPTYNFSVVVDDIDMAVTHVMRGDDHVSNTPKQIAVYRALSAPPPAFGHVPMIHGMDGKKLSKRHGATAVGDYQDMGILPGAMCNFLALLGWSPGGDRELFFDMSELVDAFSLDGLLRKSSVFDPQKLDWMNGQHLTRTPPEALLPVIEPLAADLGTDLSRADRTWVLRCIEVVRERSRTTHEITRQVLVRLDRSFMAKDDEKAAKLVAKDPDGFRAALDAAHSHLEKIQPSAWAPDVLETELRNLAESLGVGAGKVMQPVRVALTGTTVSEPVNVLLALVGRDESLARLRAASA